MMKTFNQVSQSAVYKEDEIATTLTVCGGSYGGGAKCLSYAADMYNQILTKETTMALTAARPDCHKIPCVILIYEEDDSEF